MSTGFTNRTTKANGTWQEELFGLCVRLQTKARKAKQRGDLGAVRYLKETRDRLLGELISAFDPEAVDLTYVENGHADALVSVTFHAVSPTKNFHVVWRRLSPGAQAKVYNATGCTPWQWRRSRRTIR